MELKKLPKLTKVLVTSFDKFHHLWNLYIFGLCFLVQWFSFKHAEVWRFFNLTNKILQENMICRNNYTKDTAFPYPTF